MKTRRTWAALLLGLFVWAVGCATAPPYGHGSHLAFSRTATPGWGSATGEESLHEEEAGEEFLPPGPPTCGGQAVPPGWPDFSSGNGSALLAPFLTCTSPAEFLALQDRVDMPRLVEALDDWYAVRLGALGPLRDKAAQVLHRKRATFLVSAAERYGPYAEVFALFVLASSFDDDLHQVLLLLARDKQLASTLGHMPSFLDALARRGMRLEDYQERGFQKGDVLRGLGRFTRDALATTPIIEMGRSMELYGRVSQLPPSYQEDFHALEKALLARHFSPGNVLVGTVDSATFGVPLGFYHLLAGTGQGLSSLSQGDYERSIRELAPALLLVGLYAGGKGLRAASHSTGWSGTRGLHSLPPYLERLRGVTERLRQRLGADGLSALSRYIQSSREAALLVAEGGELAAVALHEARGQVPRAQVWLSQAKPPRPATGAARGGVARRTGGGASLVDETVGLTAEVVEARLLRVELESAGPRLSGNVASLEKQRPSLEAPPLEARSHPLWGEYVAYYEGRLAELRQSAKVKPPLAWAGYERMRGLFARGLLFERDMLRVLRADAARPRAERLLLRDFELPLVEAYVGVKKPTSGLRYADVLVIEQKPPTPGQLRRVETFSFKSRNLRLMKDTALERQMIEDASEALRFYGETLDIRRPSLKHLVPEGIEVPVQRVRLIYEGGELMPANQNLLKTVMEQLQQEVKGVEVLFQ